MISGEMLATRKVSMILGALRVFPETETETASFCEIG
jgi:hypothetical protein